MRLIISIVVCQAICGLLVHSSDDQQYAQETPLSRSKRLVLNSNKYLWKNGIVPYTFDPDLPNDKRKDYEERVFPLYEKFSCIRFVKRTESTKASYPSYLIFDQTNKCSSKIGRTGGSQRIYCCWWKTCLHELAHALGFHHEHRSPLRSKFIRIDRENIKTIALSAFATTSNVNTFDLYDSDSIMHYGQQFWSKNGKPTIVYLEPDTKPVSKFANADRYFYLFMEVNQAYGCTANCSLKCENGGYVAIVDGKCKCRCPEGLDPNTQCSKLLRKDYHCGRIIELNDAKPKIEFEPLAINVKATRATCYWFIKSPPKSRILLDFPLFHVRMNNGECQDEVAVRPYLPGLRGSSYCGDKFKKTVQSEDNIIAFSLTQTPSSGAVSRIVVKASFVHEHDFCYNITNGGDAYNGKVSFAADSTPCLYWDSVGHCKHSLFQTGDAYRNLGKNFCRNPDNSKGPWCYTKSDGCERKFCDACNFGICKDFRSDCNSKIKSNPRTYCTNRDAKRDCRKACGFCDDHQPLPSISATFCGAPNLPSDAETQTFLDKYSVGDTITVKCNNSNSDYQVITCMSNGYWTRLKYVCGTCRPGWKTHGNFCYNFVNEFKKQENAHNYCKAQGDGCNLLRDSKWNHNFIKELIDDNSGGCKNVWLDLTEAEDDMVYTWSNGNLPEWKNWLDETQLRGLRCVAMNGQCTWSDRKCDLKYKFVCQCTRSDPTVCEDQRFDCGSIVARKTNFCTDYKKTFAEIECRKTCGLC